MIKFTIKEEQYDTADFVIAIVLTRCFTCGKMRDDLLGVFLRGESGQFICDPCIDALLNANRDGHRGKRAA